MVRQQGGDSDVPLPTVREIHDVTTPRARILTGMDALKVGVVSWRLGAGYVRREDPVRVGAGIEIFAKPDDRVAKGQPILRLHTDEPDRFRRVIDVLGETLTVYDVTHAPGPDVPTRRDAPSREPRDPNGTNDAITRKPRRPAAGKSRRSVVLEKLG